MTRSAWIITSGFIVLAALVAALFWSLHGPPPAAPRRSGVVRLPPIQASPAAPPSPTAPVAQRPALAAAHAGSAPAGAPPPPPISPRLDGARVREMVLEDLQESGSGAEDWNGDAETVFAAIGRPPVSFTEDGCFVAGCAATFTYPSKDAYERALAALPEFPPYRGWTAGKRLTPPDVHADGTVQMTVILYRPD